MRRTHPPSGAALTFPLDPALREPRRPDAPRPEHSHQDAENDSDWEYEYDEHETETFYLTLDVGASSASRQAQHKAPPKNRRAGADADQADSLDIEDAPTERPIAEATAKDDEDPDRHRIQMLDLHTTQPLISYQNQFYTAQWASTIGTDLFFTAPSSSETTHPTLLRTPQFDVLATSTTRLLATPATLKPRPDVATSPTHEPPNPPTDSDDIVIPVGTGASEGRIQQARFLEQLIRAKRARGESDEVTVHARRVMTGTGWRTQNRLLDQRGTLRDGQGAGRASAAHNADEYESENENENGDGDDEPMDEELGSETTSPQQRRRRHGEHEADEPSAAQLQADADAQLEVESGRDWGAGSGMGMMQQQPAPPPRRRGRPPGSGRGRRSVAAMMAAAGRGLESGRTRGRGGGRAGGTGAGTPTGGTGGVLF